MTGAFILATALSAHALPESQALRQQSKTELKAGHFGVAIQKGQDHNSNYDPRDITVRTLPYSGAGDFTGNDLSTPAPPPALSEHARKYKQDLQDEMNFVNLVTDSNLTLEEVYGKGLIDSFTGEVILPFAPGEDQGSLFSHLFSTVLYQGIYVGPLQVSFSQFLDTYEPNFLVAIGLAKYGINIEEYRKLAKEDPLLAMQGIVKANAKMQAQLAKKPGDSTILMAQNEFKTLIGQIKATWLSNLDKMQEA